MNKLYNDTAVRAIANAIRAKNGSSESYNIAEMSTALNDLSYYAKPTIENVSLATFEADGLPLNSLKVSVEAKQEGSGTPSPENVRPISGWDAVVVSDVGKNLFNEHLADGRTASNNGITFSCTDGLFSISGTATGTTINAWILGDYNATTPLFIIPAGTYTFSVTDGYGVIFYSYDGNTRKSFSAMIDGNVPITFEDDIPITALKPRNHPVGLTYNYSFHIQLEIGTSATDYEPYNPNSYTTTITLPQTVYGGELDVVNGVLRITWKSVDMGSLTWSYYAQNVRFSTTGLQSEIKSGSNQDEIMCSCYDHVVSTDMSVYKASNGLVFAKDSNYTDAASFKQSVTGQQFAYMLETPIIINLTPTLIKSLNGINNLSVDCGEVIELEYFKEV